VIIDVPQAIDAAGNSNAAEMFARDVNNLRAYFSAFAPALADTQYAREIWAKYESGVLTPEVPLTGQIVLDETPADVEAVLLQVELAIRENEIRRMCQPD